MDIQKDKIFFFVFIAFSFLSCQNRTQERIDDILSFSTKGMILSDEKKEQWGDFISDGYKIESFLIVDTSLIDCAKLNCIKYDATWINDRFGNAEIYIFIKNTSGYYRQSRLDDQVEYVIVDTTQNKLFYYILVY